MRRRQFIKSLLGSALLYRHPLLAQAPDPEVKRVLVMFKCHFDAGFVDTQAAIVSRYFQKFFPQAISLAAQLRQSGSQRYVWTTGSWLLYEYLEAATPEERSRMEKAIAQGDIAWHALPFSWQTEMMDPSMIAGAIGLSQTLDRRFGRTTTGAKMTDVPGHTRGIIAPLASQGVTFLEIGVNDASTPAQVPPIFLWKAPGGETLAVMYHHSYGGVTRVPNSDLVLATVVRDDNSGPHTLEEVHTTYANLSARFPNAQIVPTNLAEMANALRHYHSGLPVLTEEIGDTWIHGVASDPLKVARYREISRLRLGWLAQNKFKAGDATDVALLRHHLLEIEHTWGTDTKTWLDFDHYTPADLATMLDTKNYKVVQFSWEEKRDDLFAGINALPAPLQQEAQAAVKNLAPTKPTLSQPKPFGGQLETPHLALAFDSQTGALGRLHNKKTGQDWASPDHLLALFSYQTLSQEDYDVFFKDYVISTEDWAYKDFGKPNMQKYGAKSAVELPTVAALQWEESPQGHHVLAQLAIKDPLAPASIYLEYNIPNDEPVIGLNVYWFKKPATRLPEAHWLSFHPIAPDPASWKLEKSGENVSPQDVVLSGNRHMHALSRGFGYKDFFVETMDAPVVTIGVKSPLPFSNSQADPSAGIHCNLFNNAWGTNYIMWYGEDMRFRFRLHA
jgi:hypothetical protein